MPNSFTAVPNVIPGNVTIGGTLTVKGTALPQIVNCPGGIVNHTGDVTEDTVWNTNLLAGQLPNDGQWLFTAVINSAVQGGVATTVKIYFGVSSVDSFTITATGIYLLQMRFYNIGGSATNNVHIIVYSSSGVLHEALPSGGIDTSVINTFKVTITNGTSTDRQVVQAREIELRETFTPV